MVHNFLDLTGKRFGRLTVIKRADDYVYKSGRKEVMWECKCDCGNTTKVRTVGLRNGTTVSCGCKKRTQHLKHGMADTRLDIIFRSMKQRCYDKNAANYPNYGGRGIKICDEWLNNKTVFFDWALLNGYRDDLSIDRIDVNGNYTPTNCRWTTCKKQSNNRRNNRRLECGGISHTIQEWSDITHIPYSTIYSRLSMGWSVEKALNMNIPIC